jgi:hypothetical protein
MRKFRMYCVEVSNDGSEFELRFEKDGEVVDSIIEYCFDDVLIDSYKLFEKNCEKYCFDTRFDSLEININYKY